MTNYTLMFTNPWLLLLLIPALGFAVAPYFFVAKKYRHDRNRAVSTVLHCTAITIAVFLLAGVTYSYDIPNKENELILLVDCSDSNESAIGSKEEFIETVASLCGDRYKLGIVKFGYDQLYAAQLSNDSEKVYRQYLSSADPDTSATDVAAALVYASTLFKSPTTGKIVLLSDGIETDGSALSAIKAVAAEGIKVDTAYFPNGSSDEVQIADVILPEKISVGIPFTVKLTIKSNYTSADVLGLTVYDNGGEGEETVVLFDGGEKTIETTCVLTTYGMHSLKFEVASMSDGEVKNNSYYAYVDLHDMSENDILIIERKRGESQDLQEILLEETAYNMTTVAVDSNMTDLPMTIKELCEFEQVILVNIANSDLPEAFVDILYNYVYKFGGGLFTVGGENEMKDDKLIPHAYNSDDMAGSRFAEMLPVQATNYTPPIAVMIVIDCSGSMSMGKFEQAQRQAIASLDALSSRDFCGIMSFDTVAGEDIPVLPVSQKEKIVAAINDVGKGENAGSGGTIFATAIENAGRALATVDAERRHIILVTDGDPGDYEDGDNGYGKYIDINYKKGITMSVVGIDTKDEHVEKMQRAVERGGGRYYDAKGNGLSNEIREDLEEEALAGIKYGEEFIPTIRDHTSIFAGLEQGEIPPLTGYYSTRPKENVLVPLMGKYVPIYAQWKFGEGAVGSFMCDLEGIWSEKFIDSLFGRALIGNIVKSLFPLQELKTDEIDAKLSQDNYTVQVSVASTRKERETVELTIIPRTKEAIEFYSGPIPIDVADSYTRFMFEITCPGLYEIRIDKKAADGSVLATLTLNYAFSYSQEYNFFPDRDPIGERYMSKLAEDGRGVAVEYEIDIFDDFEKYIHVVVDPRIGLLIAAIVFFLLDIAVRKFKFKWPHELIREYKEKRAQKKQ